MQTSELITTLNNRSMYDSKLDQPCAFNQNKHITKEPIILTREETRGRRIILEDIEEEVTEIVLRRKQFCITYRVAEGSLESKYGYFVR